MIDRGNISHRAPFKSVEASSYFKESGPGIGVEMDGPGQSGDPSWSGVDAKYVQTRF